MKAKRSSPVNKRSLRIQITKPNYSDEKRKSPRNLSLNTKAKTVDNNLQQRATSSRRKPASANSSANQEETAESNTPNPAEIALEKIAAAKSDQLKLILDDINSKILSSSVQP